MRVRSSPIMKVLSRQNSKPPRCPKPTRARTARLYLHSAWVAECMAARSLSDTLERAATDAALKNEFSNPKLMVVEVTDVLADAVDTVRAETLRRA